MWRTTLKPAINGFNSRMQLEQWRFLQMKGGKPGWESLQARTLTCAGAKQHPSLRRAHETWGSPVCGEWIIQEIEKLDSGCQGPRRKLLIVDALYKTGHGT